MVVRNITFAKRLLLKSLISKLPLIVAASFSTNHLILATVFAQPQTDLACLATVIMSEASIGRHEERISVAWVVFNRVDYGPPSYPNTICGVVFQPGQFATNQNPTSQILDLARSLLDDPSFDPTGGATHFFSPISMPKEGEPTEGFDVGGGLHTVPGISKKVYFPSWTLILNWVGNIPNARQTHYMFYAPPCPSLSNPLFNVFFIPTLQGRVVTDQLFTFTIRDPINFTEKAQFTAMEDPDTDTFPLPPSVLLTPGNYDILLHSAGYLRKMTKARLCSGSMTSLSTLLAGDLNNDNIINSMDWSIMSPVWSTSDPVADIDGNGLVNTLDFSWMNSNWAKVGD